MDDEIVKIGKANAKSEDGLMGMEPAIPPKSNHFVLVHGAWCWYKIMELLEKDGHKVSAIDLKSAGTHPSTADSINSFEEYNQPLMDFLANPPLTEKIVLVGHSMGGVSVASASEAFPHLVAVAVYLCALMFRGGERLAQEKEITNPEKESFRQLQLSFANNSQDSPTSITMPKMMQKDLFYGKSSSLDATLASLLIRPFPYMAMTNIDLRTTEERYGAVPRVYIKTEHDKALSPGEQEELITGSPPKEVYSIDSDHSPFFSAPEKLHQILLQIANTYCGFTSNDFRAPTGVRVSCIPCSWLSFTCVRYGSSRSGFFCSQLNRGFTLVLLGRYRNLPSFVVTMALGLAVLFEDALGHSFAELYGWELATVQSCELSHFHSLHSKQS